jgi:MFS family permease
MGGGGPRRRWLSAPVVGIGSASFFSDLGHEVPTALLPSFLSSTLGAPAAALGLIEGIADGGAGVAKLVGGGLADDPSRRRKVAVGGYVTTALLSSAIGFATAAWQVGVLRTGAWVARGVRGPSRNAMLADAVPSEAYGRAYGFERAMDNLGAIFGPILAIGLVALTNVRTAIKLSVIPGLLAAAAIAYAAARVVERRREHRPFSLRIRPVLRGPLRRILAGVGAFELGNVAATLMILRATELLAPGHGQDSATAIALAMYVAYNTTATLSSVPAGRLVDRSGPVHAMTLGTALFLVAYVALALTGPSVPLLAAGFVLAGVGIGSVETAENAVVATHAPEEIRGSAFGVLAAMQSGGNLVASAGAGILWTLVGGGWAFAIAAFWMAVSGAILFGPLRAERARAFARRQA